MKFSLQTSLYLLFLSLEAFDLGAQCASPVNVGVSSNMYTHVRNATRPVAVDKDLNLVVFAHRNHAGNFGGSSGHLRYDISTDGGNTWTNNLGPLNAQLNSPARYPNVAIYNPPANTNPLNAYLGYLASTTDPVNSTWNGVVTGVRQLNGSGNTETYNQPGAPSYLIAGAMVKGAPGTFWATDYGSNGVNANGVINIYKGDWNGSNNINWNINTILNPGYNQSYNGSIFLGEVSIAFDPGGTKGWVAAMAHTNGNQSAYGYYPVLYKTVNGGMSWTGPYQVNLSSMSCITGFVSGGYVPAGNHQGDLTVDVYGNPHYLITVGYGNNAYGLNYQFAHRMMDITQVNGLWTAYDIASVRGANGTFYGSSGNTAHLACPQVARSADGKKVFFGWTDNTIYSMGDPNDLPEFFARALDVQQHMFTQVKDFTSCNFQTSMGALFPHMAKEVLEPAPGQYKLAVVHAEFAGFALDPDQPANFTFLNNCTFSNSDFSIPQPTVNISISQGDKLTLCQGSSVNLQATGNFQQLLWNNGNTLPNQFVSSPGSYVVAGRTGCTVGADSIQVQMLTFAASAGNPVFCAGRQVTLTASGNAYTYGWSPGPLSGTSVAVSPTATTVYTLTAFAHAGCTGTTALLLTLSPDPNVIAISKKPVSCPGDEVRLEAAGAETYSWSNGAGTYSTNVSPLITTTYVVTGVTAAGCTGTFAVQQLVELCTGLNEKEFRDVISLFPNPTDGKVTIKTTAAENLKLVNSAGQIIQILELNSTNNFKTELTGLSKGIYIITGDRARAQKIIVR